MLDCWDYHNAYDHRSDSPQNQIFGTTRRLSICGYSNTVTCTTGQQNTHPFGHETSRDLVHKFVFLGDDRNILKVLVNGVTVKDLRSAAWWRQKQRPASGLLIGWRVKSRDPVLSNARTVRLSPCISFTYVHRALYFNIFRSRYVSLLSGTASEMETVRIYWSQNMTKT